MSAASERHDEHIATAAAAAAAAGACPAVHMHIKLIITICNHNIVVIFSIKSNLYCVSIQLFNTVNNK